MEDKYKSLKAYWSNSKVAEREASYHPFGKTDKNTAVAGVLNVDLNKSLELKKDYFRSLQHPILEKIVSDCSEIHDECKFGQKKMDMTEGKINKALDDYSKSTRKLMDVLVSDNPDDIDAIVTAQEKFIQSSDKMEKSLEGLEENYKK